MELSFANGVQEYTVHGIKGLLGPPSRLSLVGNFQPLSTPSTNETGLRPWHSEDVGVECG